MSGSNPGESPDESGDRADRGPERAERDPETRTDRETGVGADDDRPPHERSAGAESYPTGDASNASESAPRGERVTIEDDGVARWFLRSEDGTVVFVRDVLSSVAIVAVIGLLLFAVSGIWPPLVAVESGSMEPNMEKGDLIFVVNEDRYVGDDAVEGTGVVPLEHAQENGYERFSEPGDVIIFRPNGDAARTPIIHRAHFWVEKGENWVDTKADEEITGGLTCNEVMTCPAPHDGFITKGDDNDGYDQIEGQSTVVSPDWVTGKARFGIPWLGHVRLAFDSIVGGVLAPSPVIDVAPSAIDSGERVAQVAIAGSTGLAGTGAGAVVAIGRRRN